MSELKIKQRARPAADSTDEAAGHSAAGNASATPKPKPSVIKLGAKERLNSYVTPEQKRKLRLLAIARNCSISEIVGVLTDEAADPVL